MSQQELHEFDPYQPSNVPLFEALYGKNLISLGGIDAIDNMFSDLNIHQLKALDLGFGLGGVAFYLAEHYQMNITGIEIHEWMVKHAKHHTPKKLINLLSFNTYDNADTLPYEKETFDLVYSKGVLNHIRYKAHLFHQIHTVLKPNGLFVIADWIFPTLKIENVSPLVHETKESYDRLLINAGFTELSFRDDSKLFIKFAQDLLMNLFNTQKNIIGRYGKELLISIQKQHEELIEKIKKQKQIAVRIIAKK